VNTLTAFFWFTVEAFCWLILAGVWVVVIAIIGSVIWSAWKGVIK
jgi:hypothetical protein